MQELPKLIKKQNLLLRIIGISNLWNKYLKNLYLKNNQPSLVLITVIWQRNKIAVLKICQNLKLFPLTPDAKLMQISNVKSSNLRLWTESLFILPPQKINLKISKLGQSNSPHN